MATVELGLIVGFVILFLEGTKEAYRRFKDKSRDDRDDIKQKLDDLKKRQQYLLGLNGNKGALDRIRESNEDLTQSIERLEEEMAEEHNDMQHEIRQNNIVSREIVDQLDDLDDVGKFDSDEIKGEPDNWRSDD